MKKIFIFIHLFLFVFQINISAYSDCDQYLIENVLSAPGASDSDWSCIALCVSGSNFDSETYLTELEEYVSERYITEKKLHPVKSTEWHRIIIAVNLLGKDPTNFNGINLLNDGVFYREGLGKQGLNSYIWALISISSGNFDQPNDAINTKDTLISEIIAAQNTDGSFSLNGTTPSSDITAMAIYALSFYKGREDVSVVIENAVNYLASVKNPDGSFSENNIPNAESTAQVIIALTSLGINPLEDYRFSDIKDGLLQFYAIGGFSHEKGGEKNLIASYQASCAMNALEKSGGIYSNFQMADEMATSEPPIQDNDEVSDIVVDETNMPESSPTVEEITTEATIEMVTEPLTEGTLDSSWAFVDESETENATGFNIKSNGEVNNVIIFVIIFSIVAICVIILNHKRFMG